MRPFAVARSADGSVTVGEGIHHGSDEHLPYAVSRTLTLASLKRRVGDCVLLHAGGAALPDGSTVALVGPSGTGKTTASRALCQTLGYVSDETVAVEESGRVRAWAKPLSVVIDPESRWEKIEHCPDELGLLRAPEALHLVAVIVLDRDPDLEGHRPRDCDREWHGSRRFASLAVGGCRRRDRPRGHRGQRAPDHRTCGPRRRAHRAASFPVPRGSDVRGPGDRVAGAGDDAAPRHRG